MHMILQVLAHTVLSLSKLRVKVCKAMQAAMTEHSVEWHSGNGMSKCCHTDCYVIALVYVDVQLVQAHVLQCRSDNRVPLQYATI